jgi:hemerythrin-like metal-binding protein
MITLTKELLVGVPAIDEQHKELVDRINAVLSMGMKSFSQEETQKTLHLLESYIHEHFSDEEAWQRGHGYPKYEWHRGQHKAYIAEFDKLKREFARNGASPAFSLTLNNSIVSWIVKHIETADVELGKYARDAVTASS